MDPKDIARDSSGTRCVASFLVEVAEKIPLVMLPSISVLMCHLDEEVKEYWYTIIGYCISNRPFAHFKLDSKIRCF